MSSQSAKPEARPDGDAPAPSPLPTVGIPVLPPPIALLEIFVLIVPLTLLDNFVPSFPNLADFQPHPFWLPVLLLSLQYGTLSGLVAAAVAILATLYIGWPQQDIGENHFAYLLRVWTQPALWIGTALVLGQFRLRQIERKLELQRLVGELTTQRNAIADFSGNLRRRCEALERHIASRRQSSGPSAIDALTHLGAVSWDHLPAAFAAAVEAVFGPCRATLLVNTGDGLAVAAAAGEHGGSEQARRIEAAEPIYRAVVVQGRALSVLAAGDEHELRGHGVVAVPVMAAKGERVVGLVKLEDVAPAELSDRTIARLGIVASVVAPALEQRANVRVAALAAMPALRRAPARQLVWRRMRKQHGGDDITAASRAEAAPPRQTAPGR